MKEKGLESSDLLLELPYILHVTVLFHTIHLSQLLLIIVCLCSFNHFCYIGQILAHCIYMDICHCGHH